MVASGVVGEEPLSSGARRRGPSQFDVALLKHALSYYKSGAALARAVGRTKAAVSQWRRAQRLPAPVRQFLVVGFGLATLADVAPKEAPLKRRRIELRPRRRPAAQDLDAQVVEVCLRISNIMRQTPPKQRAAKFAALDAFLTSVAITHAPKPHAPKHAMPPHITNPNAPENLDAPNNGG